MPQILMPEGTYFLGDPCYAVPNDLWDALLESCDYFNAPNGIVTTNEGKTFVVLGFSTAYGDGTYRGSDGFNYGVDAGLIGLTPIELCTDADFNPKLGTIVTFDKPVRCTNDGGNMTFGDISIDTDYEDWDDDDYCECEDDDE